MTTKVMKLPYPPVDIDSLKITDVNGKEIEFLTTDEGIEFETDKSFTVMYSIDGEDETELMRRNSDRIAIDERLRGIK